jgi:transcriptional regulator with XRE-family HTH domain
MNLEATGAYLSELRRTRGYTQVQVGNAIGISDEMVWRVEKGRGETSGSMLLRMIGFLEGSYEQVIQVMENPDFTIEDARLQARRWAEHSQTTRDETAWRNDPARFVAAALDATNNDPKAARLLLLRALEQMLES